MMSMNNDNNKLFDDKQMNCCCVAMWLKCQTPAQVMTCACVRKPNRERQFSTCDLKKVI